MKKILSHGAVKRKHQFKQMKRVKRVRMQQSDTGDEFKCIHCTDIIGNRMSREELKAHILKGLCREGNNNTNSKNDIISNTPTGKLSLDSSSSASFASPNQSESGYESLPSSPNIKNEKGRVEAVEAKNHIDEAFSRIFYAPEKNPQNRCNMCHRPVSKSRISLHKYFCKWRPLIPISGDEPFTYETAGKLSIRLLKKQPKFVFGRILSSRAGDTDLFGDEPLVFEANLHMGGQKILFSCDTRRHVVFKIELRCHQFNYATMYTRFAETATLRIPDYLVSVDQLDYKLTVKFEADKMHQVKVINNGDQEKKARSQSS